MTFWLRPALLISAAIALGGCHEADSSTDRANNDSTEKTSPPAEATAKEAPGVILAGTKDVAEETVSAPTGPFGWARWLGPDGNGMSRETGLIHRFPESGPKILWRAKLGTGYSGLSVTGGRVLTMFGEDGREKVVCFDASTGREIWKHDSDADFTQGRSFGPRATPCVDGDRVYFAGASGLLQCRDVKTGKAIWSFNLYKKYSMRPHEEGLSCSPLVDDQKLVMLAGNSAFTFDKSNGKLLWRALDEKMNHSTPRFAKIGTRRVLVVLSGSNLVGLDPKTGRELWRHPQRAVNCATPVIGPKGEIFTAAAYGFGCQLVRISDGNVEQLYKNQALAVHHATPLLYRAHLYGFHDRPGLFKCVEFATGKEKWVSRSPGKGKLTFADGQMIIVTESGELVLATPDISGYRQTSRARLLKGTCYTAPSLANGKLYVRSDRELVCIDMTK